MVGGHRRRRSERFSRFSAIGARAPLATVAAALVVLTAGITTPVHAGPPFATDDPEIPDVGWMEVTAPFVIERSRHDAEDGRIIDLDFNYGYSKRTQLSIEPPLAFTRPPDGPTSVGFGDLGLEWKHRCGEDDEKGYFGMNAQLTLPTGSSRRGLGSGHLGGNVSLLYEKSWRKTTLYSDLAYVGQTGGDDQNFALLGVACLRDATSSLQIGGEVYGTTPDAEGGESNLFVAAGFLWDPTKGAELIGSLGRSLRGDPELTLLVGVNVVTRPWRRAPVMGESGSLEPVPLHHSAFRIPRVS